MTLQSPDIASRNASVPVPAQRSVLKCAPLNRMCLQVCASQGQWDAVKQAVDSVYESVDRLAAGENPEQGNAIEALFFSLLCLQLQATWHLHHQVCAWCLVIPFKICRCCWHVGSELR